MTDELQRRLRLVQIAELYYVQRWTQSRIGEQHGLSTMQISRLLREAQQLGIVEIKIHHPLPIDVELGQELRQRFGLRSALAVRASSPETVKQDVARAGAHQVVALLEPHRTLAVAWSSTLALLAQALPPNPLPGLTVVQMLGALSLSADRYTPYDAFAQIGSRLGALMHPLHAPTVLRTRAARDALIEDPSVKGVLDVARGADYALCGIGTAGDDSTFFQMGYLSRAELDHLAAQGMAGDILGRFIDERGAELPWSYADMLVSLDLDELRRIPQVIAVAAGPSKLRAILGALRGGYCSHLITDAETARSLLRIAAVAPA
jgi:deoxyribonucleoside regulator